VDGTANLPIAASGNPSLTKQNGKIAFTYCDFLKNKQIQLAIQERQARKFSVIHSHPSHRTRAVLSQ